MAQVDQFESIFLSSVKERYAYEDIKIKKVLVVTDLAVKASEDFLQQMQDFLECLSTEKPIKWVLVTGRDFKSTSDILKLVKKHKPDLICTYRNLHSDAWKYPHSLGEHLDVMIQLTDTPVCVVPHPQAGRADQHALEDTNSVMALTDHLADDHALVNYAVKFTEAKGTLRLLHLEDTAGFEKMMTAISKISTIETDDARRSISEQLLKEPRDYIQSCIDVLEENEISITIKSIVGFGHHLTEFQKKINRQKLDLIVMHGKEADQLAMHGVSYPLAVEIRQIPLLII